MIIEVNFIYAEVSFVALVSAVVTVILRNIFKSMITFKLQVCFAFGGAVGAVSGDTLQSAAQI